MTYTEIQQVEQALVQFAVDCHPTLGREETQLNREAYERQLTQHVQAVMRAYNLTEVNQDG